MLVAAAGQVAMARVKRHSRVEVATKLAQATDLARQGKLQSEIARTLGVSVMTLHRWRKADGPNGGTTELRNSSLKFHDCGDWWPISFLSSSKKLPKDQKFSVRGDEDGHEKISSGLILAGGGFLRR
jgi:hypothetical protein